MCDSPPIYYPRLTTKPYFYASPGFDLRKVSRLVELALSKVVNADEAHFTLARCLNFLYTNGIYQLKKEINMITATIFDNNKSQAVRLPVAVRFDSTIKKVVIRTLGKDRIISPVDNTWDSFFISPETFVSDDFMTERAEQTETLRESFDD